MINKNCRGSEKIIAVYWFVILLIVAGAIAYMVFVFYGKPYSVKNVEADILINQIADCLAEGGYLKEGILESLGSDALLEKCNLNFNVEDFSDWKENEQYYIELEVYDFDETMPDGTVGELVLPKIVYGNKNLKPVPVYERNDYEKDTVVIHHTDTPSGTGETVAKNMVKGVINVQYILETDGTVYEMVIDGWDAKDYIVRSDVSQVTGEWEKSSAQHAGCKWQGEFACDCPPGCIDENGFFNKSGCDRSSMDQNCCWPSERNNPNCIRLCCVKGFNQRSVGIEVVNDEDDEYPVGQIDALVELVAGIVERNEIPLNRVIGHFQITPNKDSCPGKQFPWKYFRARLEEKVNANSPQEQTSKTLDLSSGRNFYVVDRNDNKYMIKILAIVGKVEKNEE